MSEIEDTANNPVQTSAELVVIVGTSAGSVEALSILANTLPAELPAPLVLALHIDPQRTANLVAILQPRTRLAVQVVENSTRLEPGKIYIVTGQQAASFTEDQLEVNGAMDGRSRLSIDRLLTTAASVYGENLTVLILAGSNSDGVAGAIEVKNAGGTVIVQNPLTARYPSVPSSLPPTAIDYETDIQQVGALFYDLLLGNGVPEASDSSEGALRVILEQVSRQTSLDFRPYKTSTILRRIGRRMVVTHNPTIRDYVQYLQTHSEEINELVGSFLINVTQFFRDPEAFAYIRNEILPHLLAEARARNRVLRLWSAGCSTGEEAYSLAMLLTDLLGAELPEWSIKVFATDLDEAAITFARRGLYPENLLNGVPVEYRERYFERVDGSYRISKTLRQMVIFGQQDLSRSAPFPRIDMVICRNVLIYFTPELQDYILNQFAFSLRPSNGYLFLGKAETVRPNHSYFELLNKHWKVYRCTGEIVSIPRRQHLPDPRLPRLSVDTYNPARNSGTTGKSMTEQEANSLTDLNQLRRFNELLLRFVPVGVAVIDRSYRLITSNALGRRLLGLHDIASDQDFLHSVRGIPYTQVRNAIDAVFRDHTAVTLNEVELDTSQGGSGLYLSLSIVLVQLEPGAPELAAISITDVTEQVQTRRQLEAAQAEQAAEQAQLLNELSAANRRLNDMNKELLDANEELQATNEEMVLTQEELQATVEEFEATNEELQATVEELETNNEELQATNEELQTTNEELRARTTELQDLAQMVDRERNRLAQMVELAPFYILVLRGPNLVVEAFNPRYAQMIEVSRVQGRPLEEVSEFFWENTAQLLELAHEVYYQDTPRTTSRILTRFPNTNGEQTEAYFVYTLIPTHGPNGSVDGVVIYALDETEQRTRQTQEEQERLRVIFDNSEQVALALFEADSRELIVASRRYLSLASQVRGLDGSKLTGRNWEEIRPFAFGTTESDDLWEQATTTRQPVRRPELLINLPGQTEPTVWDWSLYPITDLRQSQSLRFMLVSAIEITGQVQARHDVERLNQLRELFTSIVSHELRTPLTSIKGYAGILQKSLPGGSGEQNSRNQRALEAILRQSEQMSLIINQLLDVSRLDTDQLELNLARFDLVKLVDQIVDQYHQSAEDHTIRVETAETSLEINGDGSRLEQVLSNLLSNAIKYSPPGTEVAVRLRVENTEPDQPQAVITVRDQGRGISPEQQKYIFEKFYRARSGDKAGGDGLGLGLYISAEIVRLHRGRLWVESQPGQGSTFYLALPI